MKIDSTSFGFIKIEGKQYNHDVLISTSGKIKQRFGPKGSHIFCLEEFKEVLKEKPEVIVVGTGQYGVGSVEEKARQVFEEKGIKLIEQPTPEAIQTFNKLKGKKAGLFHVTC